MTKKEDNEQALADFNKAIELDGRYLKGYNNRGLLYKKLNEMEKALNDFNRCIEIDGNDAEAYGRRA
jgi:tetratricopeptide (TPR) repeat protein